LSKFLIQVNYERNKTFFKRFSSDEITIGASPFSNLHLPMRSSIGIHSLLQRKNGKYIITKLNPACSLKKGNQEIAMSEIQPGIDAIYIEGYRILILSPDQLEAVKDFERTYYDIDTITTEDHDRRIGKGIVISTIMTLIFLITMSLWTIPEEVPVEDISERFSRLIIDPVSIRNPIATAMVPTDGEGEGKKLEGKEGKRGSKKAKIKIKKKRPLQIVRRKGVLGALSDRRVRRQLASILKDGVGFGKKFNKSLKNNASSGKKIALFKGAFGTGLKGTGGAGGGTSKDVVGGLSTKGVGGGLSGYGRGSVGTRVASSIVTDDVNTIIKGSLERSEIEKVIKAHLPQIKYCYERELNTNPELNGKIVTFFFFVKNGNVTSSNIKESTMKNSSVETCIVRRVAKWIFPQPRGGGMVVVKYPFLFSSTGAVR